MKNLKTIGITTIIVLGIIFIGYSIKTSNTESVGGYSTISITPYKTTTFKQVSIGAGADVQAIATSTARNRASIEITNDCSSVVYLVLDDDKPADTGLRLNANGGTFSMSYPDTVYMNSIRATSSAACNINVLEGTL